MKHRKPQEHIRKLHTRYGRRNIRINAGVRYSKIKTPERKIFNYLSNTRTAEKEYGGHIDFNRRGNLENVTVIPGGKIKIVMPEDFEVMYHTHTAQTGQYIPSPEDLLVLLRNHNQKAEMVFRNGTAFTVIKTKQLNEKLNRMSYSELRSLFNKLWKRASRMQTQESMMYAYKKELENIGFKVQINTKIRKAIHLKVRPVEPKRVG